MTKKERIQKAIRGEKTDRVPVSWYRHFPDQTDNTVRDQVAWAKETDMDMLCVETDGYMQFDCGASYDESTFDTARRKFKEAGILFPVMTYWNVNARNISFPSDRIDGVQFVSGYSDAIYMSILKSGNVNAVELMEKTLKPYEKVAESWGIE